MKKNTGIIIYVRGCADGTEWTEKIRPEHIDRFKEGCHVPSGLMEGYYGWGNVSSDAIVTKIEKPVCYVIINEQHTIKTEQIEIIEKEFAETEIEYLKVPANGWTLSEMQDIFQEIKMGTVVFISPIPAMMKMCSSTINLPWFTFHNDNREKKELPNGKIISVVADTGWKLI